MGYGFQAFKLDFWVLFRRCRDSGYANAIIPRMIIQSLKQGIFVNAQGDSFVQCVSPSYYL